MSKIKTWTDRGFPEIDLFQNLTERFVTDVISHHDTRVLEIKLRSNVSVVDEYIRFFSINHLIKAMSMVNPSDEVSKRVQTIVDNSEEYDMLVDIKKHNEDFERHLLDLYINNNIKYYSISNLTPNEIKEHLTKEFHEKKKATYYIGNFYDTFL
jgi:hypothetical protein